MRFPWKNSRRQLSKLPTTWSTKVVVIGSSVFWGKPRENLKCRLCQRAWESPSVRIRSSGQIIGTDWSTRRAKKAWHNQRSVMIDSELVELRQQWDRVKQNGCWRPSRKAARRADELMVFLSRWFNRLSWLEVQGKTWTKNLLTT